MRRLLWVGATANALFVVGLIWAWALGFTDRSEWVIVGLLHTAIAGGFALAAADTR